MVDQAVPTGFDVPPAFPYNRFALVIKYDKRLSTFKDEKGQKIDEPKFFDLFPGRVICRRVQPKSTEVSS